jgi:hypothetical protein
VKARDRDDVKEAGRPEGLAGRFGDKASLPGDLGRGDGPVLAADHGGDARRELVARSVERREEALVPGERGRRRCRTLDLAEGEADGADAVEVGVPREVEPSGDDRRGRRLERGLDEDAVAGLEICRRPRRQTDEPGRQGFVETGDLHWLDKEASAARRLEIDAQHDARDEGGHRAGEHGSRHQHGADLGRGEAAGQAGEEEDRCEGRPVGAQDEGRERGQAGERQRRHEAGLLGRCEIKDHAPAKTQRDEEGEVERRRLAPEELPQELRDGLHAEAAASGARPLGCERRATPAESRSERGDGP